MENEVQKRRSYLLKGGDFSHNNTLCSDNIGRYIRLAKLPYLYGLEEEEFWNETKRVFELINNSKLSIPAKEIAIRRVSSIQERGPIKVKGMKWIVVKSVL